MITTYTSSTDPKFRLQTITDLSTLINTILTLKSQFDNCPEFYTKDDYVNLIKLLSGSLPFLYYQLDSLKQELENYQLKLVSGENIKTINNQSLLGNGNIDISGGGGTSDHSLLDNRNIANQHTIAAITGLTEKLAGIEEGLANNKGNVSTLQTETASLRQNLNVEIDNRQAGDTANTELINTIATTLNQKINDEIADRTNADEDLQTNINSVAGDRYTKSETYNSAQVDAIIAQQFKETSEQGQASYFLRYIAGEPRIEFTPPALTDLSENVPFALVGTDFTTQTFNGILPTAGAFLPNASYYDELYLTSLRENDGYRLRLEYFIGDVQIYNELRTVTVENGRTDATVRITIPNFATYGSRIDYPAGQAFRKVVSIAKDGGNNDTVYITNNPATSQFNFTIRSGGIINANDVILQNGNSVEIAISSTSWKTVTLSGINPVIDLLEDRTIYKLTRLNVASLTINNPLQGDGQCLIILTATTSGNGLSITFPAGITWYNGAAPTIKGYKEISILNNKAL